MRKHGPKRSWTDEDFIKFTENSTSKAEVIKKLGLKLCGGNYRVFNETYERLGLSTSHFKGKGHNKGRPALGKPFKKRPLNEILIEHSNYTHSSDLKKRLIKEGLIKEVCSECGQLPQWNGRKLVMVLDHINGVHNDNRVCNLRLLCPNCNSQQKTFCRGYKKI